MLLEQNFGAPFPPPPRGGSQFQNICNFLDMSLTLLASVFPIYKMEPHSL